MRRTYGNYEFHSRCRVPNFKPPSNLKRLPTIGSANSRICSTYIIRVCPSRHLRGTGSRHLSFAYRARSGGWVVGNCSRPHYGFLVGSLNNKHHGQNGGYSGHINSIATFADRHGGNW